MGRVAANVCLWLIVVWKALPHLGAIGAGGILRNEYVVNVSIMASTGNGLATGSQSNSDFIIDTQYTSGDYCAEVGERFPNNYQPKATVCSNPSHNLSLIHIYPFCKEMRM